MFINFFFFGCWLGLGELYWVEENSLIAPLFRNGQVIETFRGQGIYQPAIETAIDKLDQAQWVSKKPISLPPRI